MIVGLDGKRAFWNQRGLGAYSRDVVQGLCQYAPECQLVLFSPRPQTVTWKPASPNLQIYFGPSGMRGSFWRSFWMHRTLRDLDLFHGLSNELPFFWQSLTCKKIVTIHDLLFLRYPQNYRYVDRLTYWLKTKYATQSADGVIVTSQHVKDDLQKYFQVEPEKICLTHQSIHPLFFDPPPADLSLLSRFNLPNHFILSVGALEPNKNCLHALEALAKLKSNISLVFVGKGNKAYLKKIEETIRVHDLKNRVYFLNDLSLPELVGIYQLCSLVLFPSFDEGFGRPLVEAAALRKPLVTSHSEVFKEVAPEDAYFADPLDPSDLAQKISDCLNGPKERTLDPKIQQFHPQIVSENIWNFYQNVI